MIRIVIILFFGLILNSCVNQVDNKVEFEEKMIVDKNTLEFKAKQTTIKVVDTDFSKGRLINQQELTLWDVQKMHGHLCDGLVVGFLGLREGLYELYPDRIIDRTNTRIVSNSSPCIGDVGMYLTGGRYQFNNFYVDNEINGLYIVQRIDDEKTIVVRLKKGVKPPEIDQLGAQAINNELDACGLDSLKVMEDNFSHTLFNGNPKEFFEIEILEGFEWKPKLNNQFKRTDVLNKNVSSCK